MFEPLLLLPEPEELVGEVPIWPEPDPAPPAGPVAVVRDPEEDEDKTDVERVVEDKIVELMPKSELLLLKKPVDIAEVAELFEAISRLLDIPMLLPDEVPINTSVVASEVMVKNTVSPLSGAEEVANAELVMLEGTVVPLLAAVVSGSGVAGGDAKMT